MQVRKRSLSRAAVWAPCDARGFIFKNGLIRTGAHEGVDVVGTEEGDLTNPSLSPVEQRRENGEWRNRRGKGKATTHGEGMVRGQPAATTGVAVRTEEMVGSRGSRGGNVSEE